MPSPLPAPSPGARAHVVTITRWLRLDPHAVRRLTLDLEEDTVNRFMQSLQSHPTALPRLKAFKLLHTEVNDLDTYPLDVFLKTKKELRMFHLGWEGDAGEEAGVPLPLRDLLCQLPALEVVGLTVMLNLFVIFSMPSPEFYNMVRAQCIPRASREPYVLVYPRSDLFLFL